MTDVEGYNKGFLDAVCATNGWPYSLEGLLRVNSKLCKAYDPPEEEEKRPPGCPRCHIEMDKQYGGRGWTCNQCGWSKRREEEE